MTFQLSDRAKDLIPKARIVSFANLQDRHPPDVISRLQKADDAGQYLTDEDLSAIGAGLLTATLQTLRDQADEIVTEARSQVLAQYPGITEPGGALFPALRAEACWRDFWHFLRCVTYGIASGMPRFTGEEGLHFMDLLYQELKVPLPAMVSGLEALQVASLRRLDPSVAPNVVPCFEHLVAAMRSFQTTSV
jgi:hypothetical protein